MRRRNIDQPRTREIAITYQYSSEPSALDRDVLPPQGVEGVDDGSCTFGRVFVAKYSDAQFFAGDLNRRVVGGQLGDDGCLQSWVDFAGQNRLFAREKTSG